MNNVAHAECRLTAEVNARCSCMCKLCSSSTTVMPPPGITVAFVRPSVAYMANNSRTQSASVPKFGRKVPHLWCDSHTSFKVKGSKVKVTRPIDAHTHRATLSSERQDLQTKNLVYGSRMATHVSHRRHDLQGQRSRSQGLVISLSRLGPMLYLCH